MEEDLPEVTVQNREGDFWPAEDQELLLRAAILAGEEALQAWKQWQLRSDIDDLDQGSHRMLPLLYRNLLAHGIDDPIMKKLKGIYRYTWYRNRVLFDGVAAAMLPLQTSGIQTMLLKGSALVVLHYRDFGVRPMYDVDLLVPAEDSLKAIDILKDLGWASTFGYPEKFSSGFISVRHGWNFKNKNGVELDLHWRLLLECCPGDADRDVWQAAVPAVIVDVPTMALCATDLLWQVCVHGLQWNAVPTIRWVADAMAILRTSLPEIDWKRFLDQAHRHGVVLPLREGLTYLRQVYHAPVPDAVLEVLGRGEISRTESIEYRTKSQVRTILGDAVQLWCRHARLMRHATRAQRFAGFPEFLQHVWDLNQPWKVPFHGASLILQRLWYRGTFDSPHPE
jgi:hypothetical protein